ncbi:ATPase with role in protein import into the ER [Podospora pseudoanserina]|uniref:Endoplasmic reticulum chaperone BiP n=1 Tax=Podospora pseudoanserina TaxID=2609844 RepID=A0ABR0ILU5_9PEZI|nr:ATPase with role in protein import into the ER [Podospora pseudoanserina]
MFLRKTRRKVPLKPPHLRPPPQSSYRKLPLYLTLSLCLIALIIFPLAILPVASAHSTVSNEPAPGEPIIGIDLGTTFSCVGVMKDGKVDIIANDQGSRITPSYVAWTKEGERLVGEGAKNQFASNPRNTIFDIKRLIGRSFSDKGVQEDAKHMPFTVKKSGTTGGPVVEVDVSGQGDMKTFTPEEISAMVLGKMKEVAEGFLGVPVKHAVVTVPAYFSDKQRQATKDAGLIAGLNIVRVINEPTAAALAYGIDKVDGERTILVYDLGGGTFDVSLLQLEDGVFEVLSTAGDTRLGGEDFDNKVIKHLATQFSKANGGADVTNDVKAMGKLKREAEKAKRTLSSQMSARVEIEGLHKGLDFEYTLTRANFEELNMAMFKKTLKTVEQALKDAKVDKKDVTDIVMVGGSTRIPKIRELVEAYFGKKVSLGVNPDEAVAHGAALQGGVSVHISKPQGKDGYYGHHPPHAGYRDHRRSHVLRTHGSLSVSLTGPQKKSQIFSTAADNQNVVQIKVYEGERALTKDNNLLGKFELTGIPPAPRGVPQIEVSFTIDVNGILKVTAHDKGTGKAESVKITNDRGRLSAEEIERLILEAEGYAEKDKEIRERIEARNGLENYAFSLKNQVNDEQGMGGRIDGDDKDTIMDALSEAMGWLDENAATATAEDFEEQKERLSNVAYPITSKLYAESGGSGAGYDDEPDIHDEL